MTRPALHLALVGTVAAAVWAIPWAIDHHADREWQERCRMLPRQANEAMRWEVANQRLSNAIAQASAAPALSDADLRDLARLRGEVSQLRRLMGTVSQLREENRRLLAGAPSDAGASADTTPADREAALAAETLEAGRKIARALPAALQRYAADHANALPADFSDLRRYFSSDSGPLIGLSLFEFVREEGPLPGDALVLRESGVREDASGTSRRVYAFGDGRVIEATSADGEFDAWERAQGLQPAAGEQ
jgi:hypothetical protein